MTQLVSMPLNFSCCQQTTPSGLVVKHSPAVHEFVGLIPSQVIPKTLKMVLDASLLSTQKFYRIDQGHMVGFPVIDCKMWLGGMLYQCACNITFKCGSTISDTSRHSHDMTEIPLKVKVNWITHTHHLLVLTKLKFPMTKRAKIEAILGKITWSHDTWHIITHYVVID